MPYIEHISVEVLREFLSYDPESGKLNWIKKAAKNTIVGSEAGSLKGGTASNSHYRYIRLHRTDFTAARAAWAIHYGQWPSSKVYFVDGDPSNMRINNMKLANGLDESVSSQSEYMKRHREKHPKAWKHTDLMRKFGISLADYAVMVADHDNKCAICGQPETQMRGGKVKALAVDHDHKTGAVRGLLCSDCNTGLGKLKDDRAVLSAAIAYLDKYMVG